MKSHLGKNLDFIHNTYFVNTWSCGRWSWISWIFKFPALHVSVWNFFHLVIFWTSKVFGNDNSNGCCIFMLFNILLLLIIAISIPFQNTMTFVCHVLTHHRYRLQRDLICPSYSSWLWSTVWTQYILSKGLSFSILLRIRSFSPLFSFYLKGNW